MLSEKRSLYGMNDSNSKKTMTELPDLQVFSWRSKEFFSHKYFKEKTKPWQATIRKQIIGGRKTYYADKQELFT